MPSGDDRQTGLGTRILTVVVAPFVAAYLGTRALVQLTVRLLGASGAAFVAALRAMGRGFVLLLGGVAGAIRIGRGGHRLEVSRPRRLRCRDRP